MTHKKIHNCDNAYIGMQALLLSMANPTPGEVFNLSDDDSTSRAAVLQYAAELLEPEAGGACSAATVGMLQAVQQEQVPGEKAVSNRKVKEVLGWQPSFPTYREGLHQCLRARQQ